MIPCSFFPCIFDNPKRALSMRAQQHSKRTLGHKKAAKCRSKLLAYPSFTCIETMQTARSVLRNFLWYKKAGNARWITACFASCVLAYPSFTCIETMQTARLVLRNFLWNKKESHESQKGLLKTTSMGYFQLQLFFFFGFQFKHFY